MGESAKLPYRIDGQSGKAAMCLFRSPPIFLVDENYVRRDACPLDNGFPSDLIGVAFN
jgi:hypothetical protein